MTPRRVLLAAALALALPSTARAQFEVTDPASIVQHGIIATITKTIVDVSTEMSASLRRMGRSLRLFEDLSQYHSPDQPLWRTRQIDPAQTVQAVAFMDALNAGGPINNALVIRLQPDSESDISPDLRVSLATLDMADSALANAVDMTGKIRGNRRAELNAIAAQVEHLNTDGSATSVLEKISGSGVIRAHQARTRMELSSSLVEFQMVENKRARDAENTALRRRLAAMQVPPNMMDGADEDLANWRQP